MTNIETSFFACRGYALAALGALAWAAQALRDGTEDAAAALEWVKGGSPTAALSFDLCVQAIGQSSRRGTLREAFVNRPQEAMAQLLVLQEVMQTEDPGIPGDQVEADLRLMRSYHSDVAAGQTLVPRNQAVSEPAC